MSIEVVTDVMRDALVRVLIVSAPVILVAMIVGLIQEQTLSFVPKLAAIFITLIIAGNFMINILLEFTRHIFRMISNL